MIRFVKEQDWPAIYEIYSWYVNHTVYNLDWVPIPYEQYVQKQKEIAKDYPYLVAVHEDQVIGYACAHKAFEKASYQFAADLTIYFAQGPHYGMGSQILEALEDILIRQNIHWLIGCISKSNAVSIEFHKRHGFEFQGELPHGGFKNNQWHSVVWYGKVLKPADEYIDAGLTFTPIGKLQVTL